MAVERRLVPVFAQKLPYGVADGGRWGGDGVALGGQRGWQTVPRWIPLWFSLGTNYVCYVIYSPECICRRRVRVHFRSGQFGVACSIFHGVHIFAQIRPHSDK